jgi:1-pyrroline-5-carboxylate dehydrogenase
VGHQIASYRSYPRIVGETGGKDFVFAHPSAQVEALAVGLIRGAFEYQGQKCSAASRAYIPRSLWPRLKTLLVDQIATIRMGDVRDFSNFMNAVIDERSFKKISGYIETAKKTPGVELLTGGTTRMDQGYFVEPTVFVTSDPQSRTMVEEIFGPVLTIFVYEDAQAEEALRSCDEASAYALTGAIFAQDQKVIDQYSQRLRHAAGNLYINDKPTGAVVGQQPFGGARGSGTNDKAGSILNLTRWTSPRTIKTNLNPPVDYRYPFMK